MAPYTRTCRVVGAPVSYGGSTFKNRHEELARILGWLADPATRMITVFGRRGIGKSSLVAKVAEVLASTASDYGGVVNLRARADGPLSIERIYFACAELAEGVARTNLDAIWASRREPRDKLAELFHSLGDDSYLVILDNIEDQLSDEGRPTSRDLEIFLDVLFRAARGAARTRHNTSARTARSSHATIRSTALS